jgi:hypothetical protein
MMKVEMETTLRLHGSADMVVELFDNWEGMGLISVRFGCHDVDEEGGVAWAGEATAIDPEMARSLAAALLKIAPHTAGPVCG